MRKWDELELDSIPQSRDRYIKFYAKIIERIRSKMQEDGITQQDLAERTGYSQPNISRFFELHPTPTLETVFIIVEVLDLKIELISK